ncbi:MAG TPA: SCO1664 family protein [Acidimicrobiales bacterium]|nr:SCO1664 family protein [Acidimicrobiales bacterium]
MSTGERASAADALTVLAGGQVELQGRLPWSSNATFLVRVCHGDTTMPAVYKPRRGERPLWDFPEGLFLREVAAYLLSVELGWGIVPETVARADAPLGPGSLQRFVPADFSEHYFTLLGHPEHQEALQAIAAFDLLANNADRKSGHCLLGDEGRIWAIDNGLCFHAQPNLRTVIWDFAGRPLPAGLRTDIERVAATVAGSEALGELLDSEELEALARRATRVAEQGKFPDPGAARRSYPWPLV